MKTRPLLILAAVALLAIAAAWILWPAAPPPPAVAIEEPPAPPALRHRLDDAGWRLVEGLDARPARRLETPTAIIGGAAVETPPWFVLVKAIHPPTADLPRESRSECGGTLYKGGVVATAAHCVAGVWSRVEVIVQPRGRARGRVAWSLGFAGMDREYEPDGAGQLRHDRAILFLPEDPGGGLDLPQAARIELDPGEEIMVFGMGLREDGRLSEDLRACRQRVVDVRAGVVETAGEACRFTDADSGSLAARVLPSGEVVPVGVVSHRIAGAEHRQFYAPLRPERIRAAMQPIADGL